MKHTPIATVAGLVFALCAPAAAADRGGFLIGFTLGVNASNGCDDCEFLAGPAFGVHAGWTLAPRLAVLGEFSVLSLSDGSENSLGVTDMIGAVQYWPIHWLWVGAGAGVNDTGSSTASDVGPIAVAQAGIDFRGRRRFGVDLRGRYERRIDRADSDRSVVVSVGFVWY